MIASTVATAFTGTVLFAALVMGALPAHATSTDALVRRAVDDAPRSPSVSRVEVKAVKGNTSGCAVERAEVSREIDRSGRVAVALYGTSRKGAARGRECRRMGFATVKVFARAPVATARIKRGEPLEGKVAMRDVELKASVDVATVATGEMATRDIRKGQIIDARMVAFEKPAPGQKVAIVMQKGALRIRTAGITQRCPGQAVCARLGSGKNVQGKMQQGTLVVELP